VTTTPSQVSESGVLLPSTSGQSSPSYSSPQSGVSTATMRLSNLRVSAAQPGRVPVGGTTKQQQQQSGSGQTRKSEGEDENQAEKS
jgi:hypothetical protein